MILKKLYLHQLIGMQMQIFIYYLAEATKTKKPATFTPPNRINFFIVYELDTWSRDLNSNLTLNDCLFGGVKLAKNADPDKYVYNSYGIGFNLHSEFSLPDGRKDKNFISFGTDMSSSVQIDNKSKDILILSIGATQGSNDATLTAEA